MTSYERVEAALKHKEPDRTPIFDYMLQSPIASTVLGRRFEEPNADIVGWNEMVKEIGWEAAVRKYSTDRVDLALLLGHDMVCVFTNPLPPLRKFSSQCDNIISIWNYKDKLTNDPVKAIELRIQELEEPPFIPTDEIYHSIYYIKEEMQKRAIKLPIMAPAIKHGVWTDVNLMQTMLLEPEIADKYFSICTRIAAEEVKCLVKLGVDQIEVGGDIAGKKLIISPKCYRRFIVPGVRKISRLIHESGLYSINASDGNLWEIIEDYLIGCEVDGYIEIDSFAGMNLKRLKDEYGDKITLYGNIDCGNVLNFGSPEEIYKITVECIESGLGNGGHILCASNVITKNVSLKNYFAMVNAYREYFSLPKLVL